jgi:hypothetical protein
LLQRIRGERGPIAPAAIQHDFIILIWNGRFDVTLDDALPEMDGALGMIFGVLVIFADIDKMKSIPSIQLGLDLRDRAFLDAPLGLLDEL